MPSRRCLHFVFLFVPAFALVSSWARAEPEKLNEAAAASAPQPALEAVSKAMASTVSPGDKKMESPQPGTFVAKAADAATTGKLAAGVTSNEGEEEIRSLLKLGASLTERSDYDAAEIAYRQVLKAPLAKPADLKTALLGLARMERKQGSLTKAIAIYQRFLKDYPVDEHTPDALLELGRSQRDIGANKLAIASFYNVINSTLKLAGDGFAHYQLLAKTAQFEIAETHFQSGDFAAAAKFFTRLRLLDLAPTDRARAHFKAAYSLNLLGDYEGSVASLRDFLEKFPDDENVPEARYLLATSFRAMKRPQEAFAAALTLLQTEKARLQTDPKRWAYWQRRTGNQLANDFFEAGDVHNAEVIYNGLAALSPDPIWRLPVMYQIALCRERLGDIEMARANYEEVVNAPAAKTSPDLGELARMASWRLANLEWRDNAAKQISAILPPGLDADAAASPAPKISSPVATSVP